MREADMVDREGVKEIGKVNLQLKSEDERRRIALSRSENRVD